MSAIVPTPIGRPWRGRYEDLSPSFTDSSPWLLVPFFRRFFKISSLSLWTLAVKTSVSDSALAQTGTVTAAAAPPVFAGMPADGVWPTSSGVSAGGGAAAVGPPPVGGDGPSSQGAIGVTTAAGEGRRRRVNRATSATAAIATSTIAT